MINAYSTVEKDSKYILPGIADFEESKLSLAIMEIFKVDMGLKRPNVIRVRVKSNAYYCISIISNFDIAE